MKIRVLHLVLLGLLAAGCSPQTPVVSTDDDAGGDPAGVALAVAGRRLSVDDVTASFVESNGRPVPVVEQFRAAAAGTSLEEFKRQARRQMQRIIETKVSQLLLYERARKQFSGEQIDEHLDRIVEDKVRNFIINRFEGDRTAAEEYLKRHGMDWPAFRKAQRKAILNQWYISTLVPPPKPVSRQELLERYNQLKDTEFVQPAVISFELLDIDMAKLRLNDANKTPRQAGPEVAERLLELVRGGMDFAEAASAFDGVSFIAFDEPVRADSLAPPYDVICEKAPHLEQGRIAEPFESRRGDHIFIVKLLEWHGRRYKSLAEVQGQLERMIMRERKIAAARKMEEQFAGQAALAVNEKFTDYCLERVYHLCRK